MMEISKVNEFGPFQTNNKAALCSVPVHEVWWEFGGKARKPPGFPWPRLGRCPSHLPTTTQPC